MRLTHLCELLEEASERPLAVGIALRDGEGLIAQVRLQTALDLGKVRDAAAVGDEQVSLEYR